MSILRVHSISPECADHPSVILDQILRGGVLPQPTRTQRYNLSLILASSFLQLLDSPWIQTSFKKTDILFPSDTHNPNVFLLDLPHINCHFVTQLNYTTSSSTGQGSSFADSVDHLRIILLELCFGKILEEQPYGKRWRAGGNEKEMAMFNVMAARDWQCHNGEPGPDYAQAVGWCLGGNRSTPPDRWSKTCYEM